jgi:CheY-like chemotaxis protein
MPEPSGTGDRDVAMIRVLVADDDGIVRRALEGVLSTAGMDVLPPAGDGEAAVAAYDPSMSVKPSWVAGL